MFPIGVKNSPLVSCVGERFFVLDREIDNFILSRNISLKTTCKF